MLNKLWLLFYEFFKIGLLALGGGLSTIPFLKEFGDRYNLFDMDFIIKMIAISESTPGPIGINMSSYIGMTQAGFIGSLIASLGLTTPSFLIILLIATKIEKIKNNSKINNIFKFLRPTIIALISYILISLLPLTFLKDNNLNYLKIIIAIIFLIIYRKLKPHPIFLIIISVIVGIIFKL